MVQLPQQPHVYHRPNLPAFDGLLRLDRAFCGALRVARTLGDKLLKDMMGEKRQDVLMGSTLLYTTMKIPTLT